MEILAIIGARAGSKGLPRKNLAALVDRPLIAWSIRAALCAEAITRTVVSTDDGEIAAAARHYGAEVPFLRPSVLATDDATAIAVVRHAVAWLEVHEGYRPDAVALLQPTSPLRTAVDIDAAVALLVERAVDAVVSVCPVKHHPYWTKTIDAAGWMRDFVTQIEPTRQRQALPPVYALNGAIYLARREALWAETGWWGPRTVGYVMPAERSIDVDTAADLVVAACLLGAAGE